MELFKDEYMSKEQAASLWPILKAYAEGKKLEYTWSHQPWKDVGEDFELNLRLTEKGQRLRVKGEEDIIYPKHV